MVSWRETLGAFSACLYFRASNNVPAFQGMLHLPSRPPPQANLVSCSPTCLSPTRGQLPITLSVLVDFCQIPCLNGGRCIGRDECWCPANSTGKFCHLPVPQPPGRGSQHKALLGGPLKQSTFMLPLSNQLGECRQQGRSAQEVHQVGCVLSPLLCWMGTGLRFIPRISVSHCIGVPSCACALNLCW